MTEAEARAALAAFDVIAEVEQWIAAQRWEAIAGGWRVRATDRTPGTFPAPKNMPRNGLFAPRLRDQRHPR